MDRRSFITATAVAPLAGLANAKQSQPGGIHDIARKLCNSATPHLGAAEKYSVVGKVSLDALQDALEGGTKPHKTDPHIAWFRDWKTLDAEWADIENEDSPEYQVKWNERERLGNLICNTPATTVEGLASQYEWLRADFGYLFKDMIGGQYGDVFKVISLGFQRLS